MDFDNRKVKVSDAIRYLAGYNSVSGLIGTADFGKKLGKFLSELDTVKEDRDEKVKALTDNMKESYVKEHGLEEFPWYETDADYLTLDMEDRKMLGKFSDELKKLIADIDEEEIELDVLVITEGDISNQIASGKKYKDRGFQVSPNFYRLLEDLIKE